MLTYIGTRSLALVLAIVTLTAAGCQDTAPPRDNVIAPTTPTVSDTVSPDVAPDTQGDKEAKNGVRAAVTAAVTSLVLASIEDLQLRDVAGIEPKIEWISDPEALSPTTGGRPMVAMVSSADPPSRYFLVMGASLTVYCGAVSSLESDIGGTAFSQVATTYGSGSSVAEAIDSCTHRRLS